MIILAMLYCIMGMIMLLLKCCGALKRRLQRQTSRNENVVENRDTVASSDRIPEDLLIELERIFERIEEGRIEEG